MCNNSIKIINMNRKYSDIGEYKKQVKLIPQIPEST